ncbi:hypothetical protein Corgl_0848 [Coriobacterium glomerans PW2]|uniref:Uncharacterized protein n=1 Tax=Coriobacterium glomerans (strain ATCC 49209 / DSM 20642 / JCM 10262 / PW2) TaxID=700015 RepID=F2N7R9_CORGP|nr:hypothetical protein Corgl_0848 [Coriobacterium glomerans PW2]
MLTVGDSVARIPSNFFSDLISASMISRGKRLGPQSDSVFMTRLAASDPLRRYSLGYSFILIIRFSSLISLCWVCPAQGQEDLEPIRYNGMDRFTRKELVS